MSGVLSPVDLASLALLLLLALLVAFFRRRPAPPAVASVASGDWLANTRVEREASEVSQPALSLALLEPASGDGDPPDSLPGDLALLRAEAMYPSPSRRLSSTDPAAAPALILIDPAAAIGEEAVEGQIDPAVAHRARLLVIALMLVVVLLRFAFG